MGDCIFCKIVNREIKTEPVYEDKDFIVFKDIHPQAPVHLLVVPKKHISSLNEVCNEDEKFLGKVFTVIKTVAEKEKFYLNGYRVVINTGKDAGMEVHHLHIHILAGRKFSWPPG